MLNRKIAFSVFYRIGQKYIHVASVCWTEYHFKVNTQLFLEGVPCKRVVLGNSMIANGKVQSVRPGLKMSISVQFPSPDQSGAWCV